MGTFQHLPRIGDPGALTQFLNAHQNKQIPQNFADFLLGHLQAAHGFKDDAEVRQVVGSFAISANSKTQFRLALNCVNQALASELEPSVARHYTMLKQGFDNLIKTSRLPE
jgi:hypothetical protein